MLTLFVWQKLSNLLEKFFSTLFLQTLFVILAYCVWTQTEFSGNFWLKKISANVVFFRRKKIDYGCITSDFGSFKLCEHFLYILTRFHGCNKKRWFRSLPKRHSAKGWVSGSEPWSKILGAYVFFWFPSHNFVTTSGSFISVPRSSNIGRVSVSLLHWPERMTKAKIWRKNDRKVSANMVFLWKQFEIW